MTVKEETLGFRWMVGQKKQLEDVTMKDDEDGRFYRLGY